MSSTALATFVRSFRGGAFPGERLGLISSYSLSNNNRFKRTNLVVPGRLFNRSISRCGFSLLENIWFWNSLLVRTFLLRSSLNVGSRSFHWASFFFKICCASGDNEVHKNLEIGSD